MEEGAWLAAVHGVAKRRTELSDFTAWSLFQGWVARRWAQRGHSGAVPGCRVQDKASKSGPRGGASAGRPAPGALEGRGPAKPRARAAPRGHLVLTARSAPQLALEQRCRELRARGGRLEETLPRRVSSEQQREALGLLCRVHELELENVEMQSQALRRDGALRHRREALRRLEQRRSLCEEIIRAQRQLIQGRAPAPRVRPAESPRAHTEPCLSAPPPQTATWPSRST